MACRSLAQLAAAIGQCSQIARRVDPFLLSFELAPRLEPGEDRWIVRSGGTHRASRFALVPAVAEATTRRDLGEVAEHLLDAGAGIPEAELARPGCVDDQPALGQFDQLAPCGRVAALAVGREPRPSRAPPIP